MVKDMTDIYKILNFLWDRNSMEEIMREDYFIINFKQESKHQMKLANGKFKANNSQHYLM